MTRRWGGGRSTVAAMVGGALLLTAGCSATGSDGSSDAGYISGRGVVEQIEEADREPLPRLRGGTLDGSQFDTADHAGSVLVVNLWGSWCAPCRAEAPGLRRAWEETQEKGVQFVGLNVRDTDAAARAFERRYRITYPSITTAESGDALLALRTIIPPNAIPITLVTDRAGDVAARVIGRTTYRTLRDLIDEALEPTERTTAAEEAVDVRVHAG